MELMLGHVKVKLKVKLTGGHAGHFLNHDKRCSQQVSGWSKQAIVRTDDDASVIHAGQTLRRTAA